MGDWSAVIIKNMRFLLQLCLENIWLFLKDEQLRKEQSICTKWKRLLHFWMAAIKWLARAVLGSIKHFKRFCITRFQKLLKEKKWGKGASWLIGYYHRHLHTWLPHVSPEAYIQHKWQEHKRCYKILLRVQLSSIQCPQEQIEKIRDKKNKQKTKGNNRKKCRKDTHWAVMINYSNSSLCFALSLGMTRKYRKSGGEEHIFNTRQLLPELIVLSFRALAVTGLAKNLAYQLLLTLLGNWWNQKFNCYFWASHLF